MDVESAWFVDQTGKVIVLWNNRDQLEHSALSRQCALGFRLAQRNVDPILLFNPCSKIPTNVESWIFPLPFSSFEI